MKLIVGLGNPGSQYANTRHNAGRKLIEFIARQHQIFFSKKKNLRASLASLEWEGQSVVLAFPEVFMNVSGEAIQALAHHFSIQWKKDLLVVVDDGALPFGSLRLRPGGSDGGHNGLKSVEAFLGGSDYARLRLGIGSPLAIPMEEYVLSSFEVAEEKALLSFWQKGFEACRLWTVQSLERAMNAINANQ